MGVFRWRSCPVCRAALAFHCNARDCPWWRCRAAACGAVIDFRHGRGIQHLPDGKGGVIVRPFVIDPDAQAG